MMLGLGLWAALFNSGLHATLAGVLTALFVPARVRIVPGALVPVIRRGASVIEAQARDGQPEREAKLAILLASMLAAALGIAILLATAGPAEPGRVALDH